MVYKYKKYFIECTEKSVDLIAECCVIFSAAAIFLAIQLIMSINQSGKWLPYGHRIFKRTQTCGIMSITNSLDTLPYMLHVCIFHMLTIESTRHKIQTSHLCVL